MIITWIFRQLIFKARSSFKLIADWGNKVKSSSCKTQSNCTTQYQSLWQQQMVQILPNLALCWLQSLRMCVNRNAGAFSKTSYKVCCLIDEAFEKIVAHTVTAVGVKIFEVSVEMCQGKSQNLIATPFCFCSGFIFSNSLGRQLSLYKSDSVCQVKKWRSWRTCQIASPDFSYGKIFIQSEWTWQRVLSASTLATFPTNIDERVSIDSVMLYLLFLSWFLAILDAVVRVWILLWQSVIPSLLW